MLKWLQSIRRTRLVPILQRLHNSTVLWSWVFNGLRLAFGILLLPLILAKLPTADLGMYYVLLSLVALVPLVDFGFGPTIGRFVSYAMGGAETIQAQGLAKPGSSREPNYALLWELLFTTRSLYRYLTLALLVILSAWGTYMVELRIEQTSSPTLTRLAWAVTLIATLFDIYSNWWGVFIRNMNQVLPATRVGVAAYCLRLILSCGLLLGGAGLLSMPLGSLVGSLFQRAWVRSRTLALLSAHPSPAQVNVRKYLAILWPNSWRVGVQFLSAYLTVNANTAICLMVLGLPANAQYGLSVQLISMAVGMAAVWINVKWPLVGIYRARHDFDGLRRLLWSRIWLQNLTYLAIGAGLFLAGPWLLERFGSGKGIIPTPWFGLLILNGFLEMQFTIWGTLLLTENRVPYLWPTVATNAFSLILTLTLIHWTPLGVGALVLGPLVAGSLFNYWFWPPYSARGLGTTVFRFLFVGPGATAATKPVATREAH